MFTVGYYRGGSDPPLFTLQKQDKRGARGEKPQKHWKTAGKSMEKPQKQGVFLSFASRTLLDSLSLAKLLVIAVEASVTSFGFWKGSPQRAAARRLCLC